MKVSSVADTQPVPNALALDEIAAIDEIIEKMCEEHHVPGCAVAIVRGDQIAHKRGFGLRDVEGVLSVTPETLFPINSCTKAFTATLLEMSEDQGLLSLDDHPRKYLPYFRLLDPEADSDVQIRDLLCHRTGVAFGAGDPYMWGGVLTLEEMLGILGAAEPTAKLRQRPQFNSVMFAACGEIVARVNEMSWHDLIKRRLFQPLGMTSSRTNTQMMYYQSNYAKGYGRSGRSGSLRQFPIPFQDEVAASVGVYSSAHDMGRWVLFMLNGGMIDGERLVSERGFTELFTEHAPGFGLGWMVDARESDRIVYHAGGMMGYSSVVGMIPDLRTGVILLSNCGGPGVFQAWKSICKVLVGPVKPHEALTVPRPAADAGAAAPEEPAAPYEAPMSAEVLMQRVVDALGGRDVLRGHVSRTLKHTINHRNQGILGYAITRTEAPNRYESFATCSAGGKVVYTRRSKLDGSVYHYDNVMGSYETCIDRVNDLEDELLRWATQPELNWKELFISVRIVDEGYLGQEPVFVVEKTPLKGDILYDYVSKNTFLVLMQYGRLYHGSISYFDFRTVDEQLVPFTWTFNTTHETVEFRIIECEFNSPRSNYPELN